ncbi:unnamed protein product [Soboliphyme baturini]|uniref:AAA+ ATPase domain-containing protein n=1 Tax=Soboliphyme baturini TaxID=241478 RepID=A0A3P8EFS6_9BILA|nr:unnamed protein product [Soboliphyme baturini]
MFIDYCRSKLYLFDEFLATSTEKLKLVEKNVIVTFIEAEIAQLKELLRLLPYCRGEIFSEEHWLEFFRLLGLPTDRPLDKILFADLLAVRNEIAQKSSQIKELNSKAQGEVTIRDAFKELDNWAAMATFELTEYHSADIEKVRLVKDWKTSLNQIGENIALVQTLKDSTFYTTFTERVSFWEERLMQLRETVQMLVEIQRRWVYLAPIFEHGALPQEQARFQKVDKDFRQRLNQPGLSRRLSTQLDHLLRCQKALNAFLEEKRYKFPRFYFVGDDDLLEILGQSTRQATVQVHMKKLFAGVHSVQFDDRQQKITAIVSAEGEVVQLAKAVQLDSAAEIWLADLENSIQFTLKELTKKYIELKTTNPSALDPGKFPSQILCLCEQINFCQVCEKEISSKNLPNLLADLKKQLKSYTSMMPPSSVLQLKLKALILDLIHNIDVSEQLIKANTTSVESWHWQKQLRFYISSNGTVTVKMANAQFEYSYEYQGNVSKLVHSPLTDKCFLTLTQAISMGLGGNPFGPAGTGKTESVKALAYLLGRPVLVFNCDEAIDVKSLARIFVGLVKCGAMGCFDEFNRLDKDVLSAVSSQIQIIQHALRHQLKDVQLLNTKVEIDHKAAICITLNPAGHGYGGRQELPDNLKQLFRPIAMTEPDSYQIAETLLLADGFKKASEIARKLVTLFSICREILSSQQHYDWGLRALKTVLQSCGDLLRLQRTNNRAAEKDVNEHWTCVRSVRLNTLPKLTFADSISFDQILRDVFPGIKFEPIVFDNLKEAVQSCSLEIGIEISDKQEEKLYQLYELLHQRIGIVIVGPSGSGKTTLWKLLRSALNKQGQKVKVYILSPKSMSKHRLFGYINPDTREWTDGILTRYAKLATREDLDPEWVESLNSVLDDNHLLTTLMQMNFQLPSGERIQFGSNVNFLFECDSLIHASPATISRMGMIFLRLVNICSDQFT